LENLSEVKGSDIDAIFAVNLKSQYSSLNGLLAGLWWRLYGVDGFETVTDPTSNLSTTYKLARDIMISLNFFPDLSIVTNVSTHPYLLKLPRPRLIIAYNGTGTTDDPVPQGGGVCASL
jgi:hypothetical protein